MRKLRFFLLIIILIFTLSACGNEEEKVITPGELKNINPVQSFGNQYNQAFSENELMKDGAWIYAIRTLSEEEEGIVRFRIDNPKKQEMIFQYGIDRIGQIAALGDWVYFIVGEGDHGYEDTKLYKIKKDGSKKTKLVSDVLSYVLTKKEIYYETDGEFQRDIYAMTLDGHIKRKLGGKNLIGVDNGWIYYAKMTGEFEEGCYIYRMKPDGTDKQRALDEAIIDDPMSVSFIIENNQVFFTRFDEEDEVTAHLRRKTINGKETVLITNEGFESLNKEGDWLFYNDLEDECVYKINVNDKSKKVLVYQVEGDDMIDGILLYGSDILISTDEKTLLIKKDGTVINLGLSYK